MRLTLDGRRTRPLAVSGVHTRRLMNLGVLTAGVSHEFNNLLLAIGGQLSLVRASLARPRLIRRHLDAAERAVEQARELTRSLLTLARKSDAAREDIDLARLVDETAAIFRRLLSDTIRVQVETPDAGPVIRGDPDQLRQVLLNLVVNARDAMPRGGVLLIRTNRVRPRTHAGKGSKAWARLTVQDSGHGMTPEIGRRAFEPFFSTKTGGRGTGIGLAIVADIVRAHRGKITLESTPAVGTRFDILLPVAGASARRGAKAAGPKTSARAPGARERGPRAPQNHPWILAFTRNAAVEQELRRSGRARGLEVVTRPSLTENAPKHPSGLAPAGVLVDLKTAPTARGAGLAQLAGGAPILTGGSGERSGAGADVIRAEGAVTAGEAKPVRGRRAESVIKLDRGTIERWLNAIGHGRSATFGGKADESDSRRPG